MSTQRPFETVHIIHDWWDGPRSGIADYDGVPHAYRSIFRDDLDEWDPENRFLLSPISRDQLALVMEDWENWRRWEEAYHAGAVTLRSHAELSPEIRLALSVDGPALLTAVGEFRATGDAALQPGAPAGGQPFEVRWTTT